MKTLISKTTVEAQALVNNPSDAIAFHAKEVAIADALFQARIAEQEAIADALCMAKIIAEVNEDAVTNALSRAELAYKIEKDAVADALRSYK
jgi:hypothetical protein